MSSTDTADTRTPEVAHNPQFPALDTMRAIGALGVVITHVGFWAGIYTSQGYVGVLVARADVGVALFFVLSGFLLYRPFARWSLGASERPSIRSFAIRRAARIFPAYWVVLGSAARDEEGFTADQDHAIVLGVEPDLIQRRDISFSFFRFTIRVSAPGEPRFFLLTGTLN